MLGVYVLIEQVDFMYVLSCKLGNFKQNIVGWMVYFFIMGVRYYVVGVIFIVVFYDGDKCGWFFGVWFWQMVKFFDFWEVDIYNWVVVVTYGVDYFRQMVQCLWFKNNIDIVGVLVNVFVFL